MPKGQGVDGLHRVADLEVHVLGQAGLDRHLPRIG
jgi:hypothetical protein